MDWRVVLYAFLLSVVTGILCGIGPSVTASRPALQNSLKGESSVDIVQGGGGVCKNILVVVADFALHWCCCVRQGSSCAVSISRQASIQGFARVEC